MEKKITICIQLTEDLKQRIEEEAKKFGLSIAAYIRLAASEKLNKGE